MSIEQAGQRPEAGGPRLRRFVPAVVGVIVVLMGLLALPRWLHREKPGAPAIPTESIRTVPLNQAGKVGDLVITAEAMELAGITIAPVARRSVSDTLSVSGNVEVAGNRIARITPRVPGKVVRLNAVAGDRVRQGQVLGLIESAELARAQADWRQASARAEAARLTLSRQQKLARLGAFGQPPAEEARRAALTARMESLVSESEIAAARAKVREAESELSALESALRQALAQEEVMQSRLARAESLLKDEIIPRQDWEQARADARRTAAETESARAGLARGQARIETEKAQLRALRARLEAARKRSGIERQAASREERILAGRYAAGQALLEAESALRQAEIERQSAEQSVRLLDGVPGGGSAVPLVSSISGRVLSRSVTLGETVDTEHPLFVIVNLETVWAQLAVSPNDLPAVRPGQKVTLTAETAPGLTFAGKVASIGAGTDEVSRSIRIRTALTNRADLLKPGTLVRGHIVTGERHEHIVVPEGAMQEHTGRPTVYVAASGSPAVFEVRHVRPGIRGGGWREIVSGLSPGERVAATGTFYLKSEALKSALSDGCCATLGED
ncbi:MAG: efflux RND transporter periplasmic adaptor subunit [Armatimonadetes bacterium]|nr:efflux RND transporter periplasmic adaptor subunit [Armatimonadota bacterium]